MAKARRIGGVFSLPPDREASFWALVGRLGLDPVTMSAATLIRHCCERGRDLPTYAEGHGASCELLYHQRHGASIMFHQRPVGDGNEERLSPGHWTG